MIHDGPTKSFIMARPANRTSAPLSSDLRDFTPSEAYPFGGDGKPSRFPEAYPPDAVLLPESFRGGCSFGVRPPPEKLRVRRRISPAGDHLIAAASAPLGGLRRWRGIIKGSTSESTRPDLLQQKRVHDANSRTQDKLIAQSNPPLPEYAQEHAKAEEADNDAGDMRDDAHYARVDPRMHKAN